MDCFQLMPALKWCKCFMTETYETVSCVRIFCLEKGRGLWKASQALSSYIFFFCESKSEQQVANADPCDVEE